MSLQKGITNITNEQALTAQDITDINNTLGVLTKAGYSGTAQDLKNLIDTKQQSPIVVDTATLTAENDKIYHSTVNTTITDPTGVEGKGYVVKVLSGVATVGGVTYFYSNILNRVFVNGEWKTLSIPTTDVDSHIITIKTDNLSTGSSNDNQFTLPATGTYDVDWGDGTIETNLTGTQTHTYASIGTYDVRVSNGITSCIFNNGGDRLKLLEVKQWGTGEWDNLVNAWYGCSNVTAFPSEPIPAWSGVTSLNRTWLNCSSLTVAPDVNNLVNVTDLTYSWAYCSNLIVAPDVSNLVNVTSLSGAWRDCTSLTVASDVSTLVNVTGLVQTWWNCSSLTTAPDVSNLINVTSLSRTWLNCSSLTVAPDISALVNVTILEFTWENCSSLTALSVIGFHIENVTNATNTASGVTLDTSNYDAILIDWHARLESIYPGGVGYPRTISTSFGNSQYTLGGAAETARTALINDFGWTIADGGGI
jgi:hypothetical protein